MELKESERFRWFVEECNNGKFESPLDVPVDIWGLYDWDLLPKKRVEEILLPFLRFTLERAKKYMPIYQKPYKDIDISNLEDMEDFWRIPALVKDSSVHGLGIREKIRQNPYVMLPTDISKDRGMHVFKSGGSVGSPTPTFITNLDREIESEAFKRGFEYEGLKAGDKVLTTYNPTHKGGEEIKEALVRMGATCMLRRTTDDPAEIIRAIEKYEINVLLTSQGPVREGDEQQKGGGVNLLQLIEAGQDVLEEQIDILFLGGYRLIPEAINWAEAHNKPLVTLLGSSEAIPQATDRYLPNKKTLCRHNNLHVLNGPHYIEIVKDEDGILVPVKKGETGILAYTSVAREGTIYVRYFPGDQATLYADEGECNCGLNSQIINNVSRIDIPDDVIQTGCCIG